MHSQHAEIRSLCKELYSTGNMLMLEQFMNAIVEISAKIRQKYGDYMLCPTYHVLIDSMPRDTESISEYDAAAGEEIFTELRRVRREILDI